MCQARAERYEEEVELTVEEMGRTLWYFEWKRDWWLAFVSDRSNASGKCNTSGKCNIPLSVKVQDGLHAYHWGQGGLETNENILSTL